MDLKLLNILCCPACEADLRCVAHEKDDCGRILNGQLSCMVCGEVYPIVNAIPRFVPEENYALSFGLQWNWYKRTQIDQYSNINHSKSRFDSETGWKNNDVSNHLILEVGCGNGRFLDICSRMDCDVVGVDMSTAIDAAYELFKTRPNVHLVQASIYALPFRKHCFDKCYCIGVIQHTPDPKKSVQLLPGYVKSGGELVLTIYERKPWTLLYAKYWLRPITKRLNPHLLLSLIRWFGLVLFPITEILFRVPLLNRVFKFMIPYANYTHFSGLTLKQRYEWATLDTFDMLSPAFDQPMTEKEVRDHLVRGGAREIRRLPNSGVNVVAVV